MIIFYGSHLSNDDFLFGFDVEESGVEHTHESLHFIFDPTSSVVLSGFILNGMSLTMYEAG